MDTLAAWAALERRYDGPIPAPARLAARLGSGQALRLLQAAGEAAFFAEMARGQVRAIRLRRAEGGFYPEMLADLRLYLAERRFWRARARRLRDEAGS